MAQSGSRLPNCFSSMIKCIVGDCFLKQKNVFGSVPLEIVDSKSFTLLDFFTKHTQEGAAYPSERLLSVLYRIGRQKQSWSRLYLNSCRRHNIDVKLFFLFPLISLLCFGFGCAMVVPAAHAWRFHSIETFT